MDDDGRASWSDANDGLTIGVRVMSRVRMVVF